MLGTSDVMNAPLRTPRPIYEITVDDELPAFATIEALMEAWGDTVPELVAGILELPLGLITCVMDFPSVKVRRIR